MTSPLIARLSAKASIDFCERNFYHSAFVAEPFNVASSLPLCLAGALGCRVVTAQPRLRHFWPAYALLGVVGFGSVLLHASLRAWGQAADEVPMLWLNWHLLGLLCDRAEPKTRPETAAAVATLCLLSAVVYAQFQHIYVLFLAVYAAGIAALVITLSRSATTPRADTRAEGTRTTIERPLFLGALASYFAFGLLAWVTDFVLCEQLSRYALGSAFLHPLWHTGAALGTWLTLQQIAAIRAAALGTVPRMAWHRGALPVVELID
ncbi:ceramidase [Pelagophyceae sp. CCMP2097]|nr:ceramidase [Pelagophyceae sp. CCMP2097]|mmetsp:Transcript_16166/g.54527  ORF Transcript_16166/g.54527 Transcript_16166/m.54527 type:complete len:264 (-) Transcript_16166:83-874(-)